MEKNPTQILSFINIPFKIDFLREPRGRGRGGDEKLDKIKQDRRQFCGINFMFGVDKNLLWIQSSTWSSFPDEIWSICLWAFVSLGNTKSMRVKIWWLTCKVIRIFLFVNWLAFCHELHTMLEKLVKRPKLVGDEVFLTLIEMKWLDGRKDSTLTTEKRSDTPTRLTCFRKKKLPSQKNRYFINWLNKQESIFITNENLVETISQSTYLFVN